MRFELGARGLLQMDSLLETSVENLDYHEFRRMLKGNIRQLR